MARKAFEVEQKYVVEAGDLPEIERRLNQMQPERRPAVTQIDTYFAHPQRDFGQTDEALRLRQVGEANFITYKGPKVDTTTKTRREIELPLSPGRAGAKQFQELLVSLSFQPVRQVRKTRRPILIEWEHQRIEVALDDVADLGLFVELEISADEGELDAARAVLASLATHLGLSRVERTSYLELLLGKWEIRNPNDE